MKILYIANSRIPTEKAHGIQIMKMCEAFSQEGVTLELVLPTRKNKELKGRDPFEFYNVSKNFQLKKVFSLDPVFLMKLPQGTYIKFQSLFFIISLFFFLLFKKNKQEYIFYTREKYLLPFLHLFSRQIVWEGHSLSGNIKKYLKPHQPAVVISETLRKDLMAMGFESSKILTAHDGVDLDEFCISVSRTEARQKLNLPSGKKIILYSGHFYNWKGVQLLADAARGLSDYLFVFVGGGNEQFEKFKQKNNLPNIIYTGYQSRSQIPLYLRSADVLVLPNSQKDIKSRHTSPLKLFEYMASGTPIIASDLENFREVLSEENALFFRADDSADLSTQIKNILTDENKAEHISEKTQQDVREYSWQKRAQKIINFIK